LLQGRSISRFFAIICGLLALFTTLVPMTTARSRGRAEITISANRSGASTRVVLTKKDKVLHAVTEFDDRIEILFAEKVAVAPPSGRTDGPLLAGWNMEGDRRLVLHTGSGYEKFESFELRNPTRLILDLVGDRGAAGKTEPVAPTPVAPRTVIVIDPGHGGMERGAIGPTGLQEKHVTLILARKLRAELQRDPTISVVLTRDEDRHVPLDERTSIANHNRADLFISIHLNASRREGAVGAETYFLASEATDDEARLLAGMENTPGATRVDQQEIQTGMPDFKERGLDLILWDLAQNQYMAESSGLAEAVQREMNVLAGTRDRGVRQAPFRVLMGATMPAILAEVGFITNADEERLLKQPGYLDRIVHALARAVQGFQRELSTYQSPDKTVPAPGVHP